MSFGSGALSRGCTTSPSSATCRIFRSCCSGLSSTIRRPRESRMRVSDTWRATCGTTTLCATGQSLLSHCLAPSTTRLLHPMHRSLTGSPRRSKRKCDGSGAQRDVGLRFLCISDHALNRPGNMCSITRIEFVRKMNPTLLCSSFTNSARAENRHRRRRSRRRHSRHPCWVGRR